MSIDTKAEDFDIGGVYLAYEGKKVRPILIISDGLGFDFADVNIARISSQAPRSEFDVQIKNWQEAGLKQPSVVKCSKVRAMEVGKINLKLGDLSDDDLERVLDKAAQYLIQAKERAFQKRQT